VKTAVLVDSKQFPLRKRTSTEGSREHLHRLQKCICESGGVLDAFRRHDGRSHLPESIIIQNLEYEVYTDFNIKNWDIQKKPATCMWPIWTSLNAISGFPSSLEDSVEARERKRHNKGSSKCINKERNENILAKTKQKIAQKHLWTMHKLRDRRIPSYQMFQLTQFPQDMLMVCISSLIYDTVQLHSLHLHGTVFSWYHLMWFLRIELRIPTARGFRAINQSHSQSLKAIRPLLSESEEEAAIHPLYSLLNFLPIFVLY